MLGRHRRLMSCGRTSCRHCAEDGATRAAKRIERREFARSLQPETDDEWLRTLGPCFTDVGVDCQHGCNGDCVEFGGEQCTFTCHE
jgi:hypothetical protein